MPMTTNSLHNKDQRTAASNPTLEHRHYAVFANVIKNYIHRDIRTKVANRIADGLKSTNPKFSKPRFLLACGVSMDEQRQTK